jgi:hypothetical protein
VAAGFVCLEQLCGSIVFGRCLGRLIELRLTGVCQVFLQGLDAEDSFLPGSMKPVMFPVG